MLQSPSVLLSPADEDGADQLDDVTAPHLPQLGAGDPHAGLLQEPVGVQGVSPPPTHRPACTMQLVYYKFGINVH